MHMHRFQPVNRDSISRQGGGQLAVGLAATPLRFRRAKPAAGGPERRPPARRAIKAQVLTTGQHMTKNHGHDQLFFVWSRP